MPILAQEPDVYPEGLFVDDDFEPADESHWWAVYTLSRREKDLMRRLRAFEISHYGPMIKRRRRSPSGRIRITHVPLFAGYVFLLANEEQRHQALTTNCISRCLPIPDADQLWHDLRQISRLVEGKAQLTPEARIEPGMAVRIKSGSMAGTEGYVVKRHGQQRLVVAVRFLQQGASVLMEDVQVERI